MPEREVNTRLKYMSSNAKRLKIVYTHADGSVPAMVALQERSVACAYWVANFSVAPDVGAGVVFDLL